MDATTTTTNGSSAIAEPSTSATASSGTGGVTQRQVEKVAAALVREGPDSAFYRSFIGALDAASTRRARQAQQAAQRIGTEVEAIIGGGPTDAGPESRRSSLASPVLGTERVGRRHFGHPSVSDWSSSSRPIYRQDSIARESESESDAGDTCDNRRDQLPPTELDIYAHIEAQFNGMGGSAGHRANSCPSSDRGSWQTGSTEERLATRFPGTSSPTAYPVRTGRSPSPSPATRSSVPGRARPSLAESTANGAGRAAPSQATPGPSHIHKGKKRAALFSPDKLSVGTPSPSPAAQKKRRMQGPTASTRPNVAYIYDAADEKENEAPVVKTKPALSRHVKMGTPRLGFVGNDGNHFSVAGPGSPSSDSDAGSGVTEYF